MQFRKDINGLRAIAVIAVVLFHFNENLALGGFVGVDVFFVISGFLMTSIICRKLEANNFSFMSFYAARINRIVPALGILCLTLLLLGIIILPPLSLMDLSKHIAGSLSFISNVMYWRESGYFDVAAKEKWLLHTWSLSVEWQFYVIYPIILYTMSRLLNHVSMKRTLIGLTFAGFIVSIIVTHYWPSASYYLIISRAWEMMLGGIAFLYPLKLKERTGKKLECIGLTMILLSCMCITEDNMWPGYLTLIPVIGVFLVIQANQNSSLLTGNYIMQALGKWSYSIYLWHWPIVVAMYYYSIDPKYTALGIIFSVFLGYLSYTHIESLKYKKYSKNISWALKSKPIWFVISLSFVSLSLFYSKGLLEHADQQYKAIVNTAMASPYRDKCHLSAYKIPSQSCEYFGTNISWATFGDSHTVEIAYALATKLRSDDIGIKHYSFSGCKPSYRENSDFSACAKWYNEAVEDILSNDNIQNVLFNHRFTSMIIGGDASGYPKKYNYKVTKKMQEMVRNTDILIRFLASKKENVYIFYPIPELPKSTTQIVAESFINKKQMKNIVGTSTAWYEERNNYIIDHFNTTKYPGNVHFIDPKESYCDEENCYAVKDGESLYFDDDHPSVTGAERLVDMIKL